MRLGSVWLALSLLVGCVTCGPGTTQKALMCVADDVIEPPDPHCDSTDAPTLLTQTEKLLGPAGHDVRMALTKDSLLTRAYLAALGAMRSDPAPYDWVRTSSAAPLTAWHDALAGDDAYDPALVRVFTYLAAIPDDPTDFQRFRILANPEGTPSCYRRPLALSERQAHRARLAHTTLAAPVLTDVAAQGSREEIGPLLDAEAATFDPTLRLGPNDDLAIDPIVQMLDRECAYARGDDNRDNTAALPALLAPWVGTHAAGMPDDPGKSSYILNRMVRWFAADLQPGAGKMTLDDPAITLSDHLDQYVALTKGEKQAVIDDVGALMARAALVPCLAVLGDGAPRSG